MLRFTDCCGKPVSSHTEDEEMGYVLTGPIPHSGNYYCERCKRDVTVGGTVRNTPRNKDIDLNGSHQYLLGEKGKDDTNVQDCDGASNGSANPAGHK